MWINKGVSGLAILCLLLVSHFPSAASQHYMPSTGRGYQIDTDLQSLLQDTTISQDKELIEALAWINKLPTETSCTQLAAMKLMTECKLLDDPSEFAKQHPDVHLDNIKLEYAVKLAACEITGAQPDQPYYALQNCEVFLPSTQACVRRSWWGRTQQQSSSQMPCYPDSSEKDLHSCFKTLRASPQHWTSYSNAKFRAANMCQLSRHAIEREKTIQLHKNLTLVTFRLQSSLHGIEEQMQVVQARLKESTDDVRQSNEKMKQSADHFQRFFRDSRIEAQKERDQTAQELQSVQMEIGRVREYILTDLAAHNERFNAQMDATLTKAVSAVQEGHTDTLSIIGAELQTFYQGLRSESAEIATFANEQLQQYHDKALQALRIQHGAVVESYSVLSGNLDNASDRVAQLKDTMDGIDAKTTQSLAKIDLLDHRLDSIGKKFKSFERAFALLDAIFDVGKTFLLSISILLGLFLIVFACKTSQKIAFILVTLFLPSLALYSLSIWVSLSQTPFPTKFYEISHPSQFIASVKSPAAEFLILVAICCFAVAAFLPNINAFYESISEPISSLANRLACRLGLLCRRHSHGDTITLPTGETYNGKISDYPNYPDPKQEESRTRFDSFLDHAHHLS